MITIESMMSIDKSGLQEASKMVSKEDIPKLVEWLSIKDDNIRYHAFLLLQNRSLFFDDVYPYWDILKNKLKSDNSYQRSIGLMLIAENAKWDVDNRMKDTIDEYLEFLNDVKPITVRQCIQSLGKVVPYNPDLINKIARKLISFNLMSIKETMCKSILLDILKVLIIIRKNLKTDEIESFIINALSGEILDNKAKKQVKLLLGKPEFGDGRMCENL
ncbi:MAG: hypothetical protein ACOWWR_17210 [Eubacteriales bacterium]